MRYEDRIGRRLKLRDLHILLAIAQSGSMAKAAELLSVSKPVVSKAIADLEHTVGVRLLDRNSRGVAITDYGRALIEHGGIVFDELRQAVLRLNFLADPKSGEIRIGTSVILAMGFTAAAINLFSKRYPRVVIHLTSAESGMTYRSLEERKVDLIVVGLFGPLAQEYLATEVLCQERYVVAAGARSRSSRRPGLKLGDLMDERWILPPPDSLTGRVVVDVFRANGLELPPASIVTDSIPARNALVATGRYLTIVPESVFKFELTRRGLIALPVDISNARRGIGIVTLRNRTISAATSLFIDCAREIARAIRLADR